MVATREHDHGGERIWQQVPAELLNMILSHLDKEDLCNMRLTSKALRDCCYGSTLYRLLEKIRVNFTRNGLEGLRALVENPMLRTVIKDIRLVAVYHKRSPPIHADEFPGKSPGSLLESASLATKTESPSAEDATVDQDQLQKAFTSFGKLRSITLDGCILAKGTVVEEDDQTDNWPVLWPEANRLARTFFHALARSKLHVETIDVFSDTYRCSLPLSAFDGLSTLFDTSDGCQQPLHGLRTLKMSLSSIGETDSEAIERRRAVCIPRSPYIPGGLDPDDLPRMRGLYMSAFANDHPEALIADPSMCNGITKFLDLWPDLHELALDYFDTCYFPDREEELEDTEDPEDPSDYERYLSNWFRRISFPELQKFELSGFGLETSALRDFLGRHEQLENLSLDGIRLIESESYDPDRKWPRVFEVISGFPNLRHLSLAYLEESYCESVNLAPIYSPNTEAAAKQNGLDEYGVMKVGGLHIYARKFDRQAIQRGLGFHPTTDSRCEGSMSSTNRYYRRLREKRQQFMV